MRQRWIFLTSFCTPKSPTETEGRQGSCLVLTPACLQVLVEFVPRPTATLVPGLRQVGTDVGTAMLHHRTQVLR